MKWALIVRAGTVVVYGTNFLQARFWKTMRLESRSSTNLVNRCLQSGTLGFSRKPFYPLLPNNARVTRSAGQPWDQRATLSKPAKIPR
jgi:hypothetical protein